MKKRILLALILIAALTAALLTGCMPDKITVSFDVNGGKPLSPVKFSVTAEKMDLPIPERDGFSFDCWCYDTALTERVDETVIPEGDVTFYARWTANLITITFNGEPKEYRYVPYGGNLTVSEMPEVKPVREGYVGRWKTDDLINVTAPMTIEPEYIQQNFSVKYIVDGEIYYEKSGTVGENVEVPENPVSDDFFMGWYLDENFTEPARELPTSVPDRDAIFYARFIRTQNMASYLTFSVSDGKAIVTGLTEIGKLQKAIVIPETLGGRTVTTVGDGENPFLSEALTYLHIPPSVKAVNANAFKNLSSLTEISLSSGLVNIGDYAFYGCDNLLKVTLPDTVEAIGEYAFAGSGDTDTAMKLYSLEFSEGSSLKTIGAHAFKNAPELKTFIIPDSESYVFDYSAFYDGDIESFLSSSPNYAAYENAVYSSNLSSLVFVPAVIGSEFAVKDGAEKIEDYAFYGNPTLTSVSLPASVKQIGIKSFYGCSNLASVIFAENSILEEIGENCFEDSGIISVSLPAALSVLGAGAFKNAASLKTITLNGDNLTEIPDGAFEDCVNLNSFDFGANITKIGNRAFYGCSALSQLNFPSSSALESVEGYAFADCSSLAVVNLPVQLKRIGDYAFAGLNDRLTTEPVLSNAITYVGDYAFKNTRIRSFSPSSALEHLGTGVFYNCTVLRRANLPINRVFTEIPAETFYNCTSLGSVTVPANIVKLGEKAFFNCTGLTSVSFNSDSNGTGVTEIGKSCFENCTALVNNGGTARVLPSTLSILGERAYYGCSNLEEITVPENLLKIPSEAFARCASLKRILYDADCVTDTLGENSFAYCTSLTEVNLPSRLGPRTSDGGAVKNPFIGCTSLNRLNISSYNGILFSLDGVIYRKDGSYNSIYLYPNGRSGSFTVNKTVANIDDYAFYGTEINNLDFEHEYSSEGAENVLLVQLGAYSFAESSLVSAVLSRRVFHTDEYAFANSDLSSLAIESTEIRRGDASFNLINGEESNLLSFGDRAFQNTKLSSLNLPARITFVGKYAFSDVYFLNNLTFEDGNESLVLGEGAFRYNSSLENLTFPSRLTEIGDYAFADCLNVSAVTFADSEGTLKIGNYAFRSNHYLYTVSLPSSIISLGVGVFSDCTRLTGISFPTEILSGSLEIPDYAFFGSQSLSEINIPAYVTRIGDNAFLNANISVLVFNDAEDADAELTIGAGAFENTDLLKSVEFPSHLSEIGERAFFGSGITQISYGEGKDITIYDSAFENTDLISVSVTTRLILAGARIFAGTEKLNSVSFNVQSAEIGEYNFFDSALKSVEFSDSVLNIGKYAFGNTAYLSEISASFDDGAVIGEYAFRNSALSRFVGIFNGGVSIKDGAFISTANLINMEIISDGDVEIGNYAFADSAVSSLKITGKITALGKGSATAAKNLSAVEIDDLNGTYFADSGILYKIEGDTAILMQYPAGKRGAVLDIDKVAYGAPRVEYRIAAIADYAFNGNSYLTNITVRSENKLLCGENAFGRTNESLKLYVSAERVDDYSDWDIPVEALQEDLNELIVRWIGGDRYAVVDYTGTYNEIVIEGLIEVGDKIYRIESIDKNAFANNARLTSITLAGGVKEIGEYAFANCVGLVEFTVGDNVTDIKPHAFDGCTALQTVNFGTGLRSIGDYAFHGCTELNNLVLPDSLTDIGNYAFSSDGKLNSIAFGQNLVNLGDGAFENDGAIIELRLPASLKNIGDYAFRNCDKLSFIYLTSPFVPTLKSANALKGAPNGIKFFVSENMLRSYKSDGYWREYSEKLVSADDKSEEVGFENYVLSEISSGEYKLVSYLGTEADVFIKTDVNGKGTITEIGEYCFSLFAETVRIDEGATVVSPYAFVNAVNLNSVELPDTVVAIGSHAFENLSKLSSVKINGGAALSEIGDYAFYNCTALTSFAFPSRLTLIGSHAFGGGKMNLSAITFAAPITVDLRIMDYAFENNEFLKEIVFNCAVRKLGDGAFSGCKALHSIYFNATGAGTVAEIDAGDVNVFESCDQLSIFLPLSSIINAYMQSWSNNADKYKLFLSSNVASDYIDENGDLVSQSGFVINQLSGSSNLASIVNYVGNEEKVIFPSHITINNVTYQITRLGRTETNTDSYVNGRIIGGNVKEIVIPNSVTEITGDAFRGAENLKKVSFEENSSLISIYGHAFAECPALEEVDLPKSLSTLGQYAFADCGALKIVRFENITQSDVIGDFNLRIGERAFQNSALEEITLPKQTASIGEYAFNESRLLRSVNLPVDGKLGDIARYAFAYTALKNITVPESVGTVGDSAFAYCNNLVSVRLTRTTGNGFNSLTSTTDNVFRGVDSPFVKVYVPEVSYTSYASNAGWSTKTVIPDLTCGLFNFRYNAGLTVTITNYLGDGDPVIPVELMIDGTPYRVTSLASHFGNDKIKTVTFESGSVVTNIESYAFADCVNLKKVHLPDTVTSIGARAFNNCVSLIDVVLSERLTYIPEYAFNGCLSLSEIYIPASVNYIDAGAFMDCRSLFRVEIGFVEASTLGLSAFAGTSDSLVIIVPEGRQDSFANEWSDCREKIHDRARLYGDFVLVESGEFFTLVQYIGRAEKLDFNEIIIDGKYITEIRDNAVTNPDTEIIRRNDTNE